MTEEKKDLNYEEGIKALRIQCEYCKTHCGEAFHFNLAKLNFNLEKEISELKKICDYNCPVHKLATHNACLTCPAVRNSPHHDLKNVTDEELQKIIKDAEAEMEMYKYAKNRTKEKMNYLMNKISIALKDDILAQGFEIICKRISDLEKENEQLCCDLYNTKANLDRITIEYENCEKELDSLKKERTELLTKISEYNFNSKQRKSIFRSNDELEKENKELKCCGNCKKYLSESDDGELSCYHSLDTFNRKVDELESRESCQYWQKYTDSEFKNNCEEK